MNGKQVTAQMILKKRALDQVVTLILIVRRQTDTILELAKLINPNQPLRRTNLPGPYGYPRNGYEKV